MRPYSLAHLTVLNLPPPAVIETAHAAGYTHAGLRLLPASPGGVFYDLANNAPLLRETQSRLKDTGIEIFDVEIVRLGPDFRVESTFPFLDNAATLGARAVLVAGDDPDQSRLAASYAAFCEAAAPRNLTGDIEFMPWTEVPDIAAARRLVKAAGTPANAGILVDALHYGRSSGGPEAVAAIPRNLLHYGQICDAPAEIPTTVEGLIQTARQERLLPGTGGIDILGMLGALPPELPLSVELPNFKLAPARGPLNWAKECLAAARKIAEKATP
ncbi:sugar phosphate isomerase/epimerase family protein [Acidocella aminolytica]|jgi:sugar phosphate isomerase/epimerase|uniref:Xylose isomerase n=1 Tax=Acidocella aminolytica 101 = DSM 11237 TaxID=1120923 RepID=A0A0D6PD32_9PROT|nr:TIM barrel protein [Acidocella aminolytica]GAN79592.1 xylose isomerase [Acidocella aminolytica 101 = DSM 11237]GBQ39054.1 sugar phosphate isomerase/epimerase [Acidocella aminolytica 101 = DSM 11237]SHF27482.1 Sugar phosphate isomerase/epimerase [Acidocella aminolytica 101 = DSM 11237]